MLKPFPRLIAFALSTGLLGILLWFALGRAQAASPPATAPDLSVPGLSVTFESLKDKTTDARTARLIALHVPAGTPATPFLAPGPFKATFEGFIDQRLRSDYELSAIGVGKLKVTINDKPAFDGELGTATGEKVTLKKGKNKIVATYESPEQGEATLRLSWSGEDFPTEPIDPKLFTHDSTAKPLTTGMQLRRGRALFADLHCVRCHTDASLSDLKDGMPELAKDAPNLDEIGARLNAPWMARWISNPKSLRPDASMPNLFHGKGDVTVQEGADIAAFLATRGATALDDAAAAKDASSITAGGRLVARLGCIGCHSLGDKEISADPQRVSWRFIKAKYKPAALIEFLKQPEKHYAWIRMPNFRFSDDEAKKVAAYLLSASRDLDGATPPGDPVKGAILIESNGCVYCHTLKVQNSLKVPVLAAISKEGWTKGCLADDAARGKTPDFGLDPAQRDALRAFAGTDRSSLKRDALPEFAERQISDLRCMACHTRDLKLDIWDNLVKETEALSKGDVIDPESNGGGNSKSPPGEPSPGTGDQTRPLLTWTGEKLHAGWMGQFIAGKVDYKPRAWMLARMPGFPARGEGIAKGLALQHGLPLVDPEPPTADAELAVTGKLLVGRNGGFSCIQCHGIGSIPPISPFEAPSINFKYVNERVRKDYYDRWMRNPARLVPNTKMPSFADADAKTPLRDILEGDAPKQFDAIWNYLMAGRKSEHPEQENP